MIIRFGASEVPVKAMILKEFRELRRDKRTMGMLVALPILLLVVFGYAANFNVEEIPTAVVGDNAEQYEEQLPDLFVAEPDIDADASPQDLLRDNVVDVAIDTSSQPAQVYIDGSSIFAAQSAQAGFAQAPEGMVEVEVLYNPDLTTAWVMVPALIGLILAFIGTIITSIGLVKERQTGTIEQLAVMPLKSSQVIMGKIVPYFILACVDMVIVTVLGVLLFDVPFVGSVGLFAVGAAIFLFVVLGLGVLISTASQTQGQAIQMAMMTVMPQILLSGFIFPLDAMPAAVSWIGYILPLTYFVEISQGIMLRGADMSSLGLDYGVLVLMAVVIFTAAVLRFRRDLAPSSRSKGAQ